MSLRRARCRRRAARSSGFSPSSSQRPAGRASWPRSGSYSGIVGPSASRKVWLPGPAIPAGTYPVAGSEPSLRIWLRHGLPVEAHLECLADVLVLEELQLVVEDQIEARRSSSATQKSGVPLYSSTYSPEISVMSSSPASWRLTAVSTLLDDFALDLAVCRRCPRPSSPSFLTKVTPLGRVELGQGVGAVVEEVVGALGVLIALLLHELLLLRQVRRERGQAEPERRGADQLHLERLVVRRLYGHVLGATVARG